MRCTPSKFLAHLLIALVALPTSPGFANPRGGRVRGGDAAIRGQGTSRVDVHQRSHDAILEWDAFDVEAGETTRFYQPSADAVAINRTLQSDPSRIFGSLVANGHVYLINPNGILFGPEARVDTRGLVATTSFDGKALAQRYGYDASARAAAGARIENHGRITAGAGGYIYLVAPYVENGRDGVLVAPDGEVQIAAGSTVYLTDRPGGIAIAYTAAPDGSAVNLGQILAEGGLAKIRAAAIRQGGVIEATTARGRAGEIELVAEDDVVLEAGSRTAATAGSEAGELAGSVRIWAEDSATLAAGAVIDVSASAPAASGGFAELSARNHVEYAGRIQAGAGAGGRAGQVLVDPATLTLSGAAQVSGAGRVLLTADQLITVAASVTLDGAGSASDPRQRLSLRSGGDVVFSPGAVIRDGGSGLAGSKTWDVDLIAGADITRNLNVPNPSDADVFALDASRPGSVQLGEFSGVELTRGVLRVRATRDLVLEHGSALRNVFGDIDVHAGRDVLFRALRVPGQDTVIENGAGDVFVVADGSVRLQPVVPPQGVNDADAAFRGNAAIRTRGVAAVDALGRPTRESGGSVVVWARTGDVDAGVGNRWIASPPGFSSQSPEAQLLGVAFPDFEKAPVVNALVDGNPGEDGILGIGTEAGGDVVVIAGRDVATRASQTPLARSGGTASNLGTTYDGSHIGVFGVPVAFESFTQGLLPYNGAFALPGATPSRAIVIAGRNLEGDFAMRGGLLSLLAGYELPASLQGAVDLAQLGLDQPLALTRDALRAQLGVSQHALASEADGWVGTLATPLSVDLIDAQVDMLGRNGVALRAIENPTLVYARADIGNARTPSFGRNSRALIEAETGDVLLVGNEIDLRTSTSPFVPAERNPLVRLLPAAVEVRTHAATGERPGDLVLLNDFLMYSSTSGGGLTLDVAGKVRTANGAAGNPARVQITAEASGTASNLRFEIPAGARLLDPATGLVYVVGSSIQLSPRDSAVPAEMNVRMQADSRHFASGVTIPAGTRLRDRAGNLYVTKSAQTIPPAADRFSTGEVYVVPRGGAARKEIFLPARTRFVDAKGNLFEIPQGGGLSFAAGDGAKSVEVVALSPGVDAASGSLRLAASVPGVASATNLRSTARPASTTVRFEALVPGQAAQGADGRALAILDPVAGVAIAVGAAPRASGGRDLGQLAAVDSEGTAVAPTPGPTGEIRDLRVLRLLDPQLLPPGVDPKDVVIQARGIAAGGDSPLRPTLFRSLQGGLPDAAAGTIPTVDTAVTWQRDGAGEQAGIRQSDADPDFDPRTALANFDANAFAGYYALCRSGASCSVADPLLSTPNNTVLIRRGALPTHANDATPASLRAGLGFERVAFELAEAAEMVAGPGNPRALGGRSADIVDTTLVTQHTKASDVTRVSTPFGSMLFGSRQRTLVDDQTGLTTRVDGVAFSGVTVAGPGKLVLESGDSIELSRVDLGSGSARGIETVGNLTNEALRLGGASIEILVANDLRLNDRGAIDTLQGGDIQITSSNGSVIGGMPTADFTGKRGIFTLFFDPRQTDPDRRVRESGGGEITVGVLRNFDIGRSAIATLSGGDITVTSETGSISAGIAQPIEILGVAFSPATSLPSVEYRGGGIFVKRGSLTLEAKRSVDIGAGFTVGGDVNVAASKVLAGRGSIAAGGDVNFDVSGSISGSVSAGGNVNVSGGGSVSQGSSISAGGLVAGGGSGGAASNTGAGKASAETAVASRGEADMASAASGFGSGSGARRGVLIDVTSTPSVDSAPPRDEDDEELDQG